MDVVGIHVRVASGDLLTADGVLDQNEVAVARGRAGERYAAICGSEVDPISAVLERTDGRGVDVAITAAASGKAQEDAVRMVARRGRGLSGTERRHDLLRAARRVREPVLERLHRACVLVAARMTSARRESASSRFFAWLRKLCALMTTTPFLLIR